MPLVPRLTPGWPRGWNALLPLVVGGVLLFIALARFVLGARPRVRDLLVVAAFPLYALYTGNGLSLASADNAATRRIASQLLTRGTLDLAHDPPLGDCRTAGYEATYAFEAGDEGKHEIQVLFQVADGRQRHYPPRRFTWKR